MQFLTGGLNCTVFLQEKERQLQLEHLAYQEQEVVKQLERQKQIMISKEAAKKEIEESLRKRRRALKKKEVS